MYIINCIQLNLQIHKKKHNVLLLFVFKNKLIAFLLKCDIILIDSYIIGGVTMKQKVLLFLSIAIFIGAGIYLTFFSGNTSKFDSQVEAYRIDPNESYDSEDGYIYHPVYYFKVNEKEYECKAKTGSSTYPKEKKNKVYYDSKNPKNCKTEYEKSTSLVAGIICLVVSLIIIYFAIIKRPTKSIEDFNEMDREEQEKQNVVNQEDMEKIMGIISKAQLIYKRVILGIIIAILLVFILIDTMIVKQTIKSKDYPEVTATLIDRKEDTESSAFIDCVYSFIDKNGKQQEITVSIPNDEQAEEEIKIKYNEKNPEDYYQEGATMDKSGIIWYIVKVVALILLVVLFFNKKILNKINISVGNN